MTKVANIDYYKHCRTATRMFGNSEYK